MRYLVAILLGLALALGFGVPSLIPATFADGPSTCMYFAETGHNIHGAFMAFYQSHNGAENFGLPLTEAFWEKGFLVQYFQRAYFELHPENPEPYRVLLGMLGEQYGITDMPIKSNVIPPANNPNFRYFLDTGQMISFTIKEYFDRHGGVNVFGYPVSGLRFESGSFVQYFQRQRLVWDPTDTSSKKVRLSPVGQLALDKNHPADSKWRAKMPSDWCERTPLKGPTPTTAPFVIPTPILKGAALSLQVHTRFRQTGVAGPQFVDVAVEDQNARRVSNAALYAAVLLPNGERWFPLLSTNASGNSSFSFEIGNQPRNSTVLIQVFAFSGSLTAVNQDIFTCH